MNDYDRIAQMIRYLDDHYLDQPSLDELAGVVGLSPFHFHRLFVDWAGVTPKAFLRCLTLGHARALLGEGQSVMGAAMGVGLSGPSRLHDLCVTLEAASPGEIKAGGAGMEIRYGFGETPFGCAMVGLTERGVCHLAFVEKEKKRGEAVGGLAQAWPRAELVGDDVLAGEMLGDVFGVGLHGGGRVGQASVRLRAFVQGTPFQLRVWRALLEVGVDSPGAALSTYGRIAKAIGQPTAARAVGTAVGANPIAYLIPCHRVIQTTGAIGGYRWGPTRKRAMIAWEMAMEMEGDATDRPTASQ